MPTGPAPVPTGPAPASSDGSARREIPLIGVSTYVADAAWGAWHRPAAVLPEAYYELVAAAGGRPLLLPPLRTAAHPGDGAQEVVARLDGLVLAGGGDIDPALYGQEAGAETGGVDPVRDGSEAALLAAALRADLPVLAICRGLQILNIVRGGTLTQHAPAVVGHEGHRPAAGQFGEVKVVTSPGTRTASIFGAAPTVLCSHHQAIDDLGSGLVATAHADDGLIEAVELPGSTFVLGVQWHPEEGGDERPFVALVDAARRHRAH